MKIYSNMSVHLFLENVRAQACAAKAPPLLIDKLDELLERPDQDDALEKAGEELEAMRESRNDLAGELRDLLQALNSATQELLDESDLRGAIHSVANALKRSGNNPD